MSQAQEIAGLKRALETCARKNAEARERVTTLEAERDALKTDIAAIRDEASNLLSCHIETPNLAKDALRRMRTFIDNLQHKEDCESA